MRAGSLRSGGGLGRGREAQRALGPRTPHHHLWVGSGRPLPAQPAGRCSSELWEVQAGRAGADRTGPMDPPCWAHKMPVPRCARGPTEGAGRVQPLAPAPLSPRAAVQLLGHGALFRHLPAVPGLCRRHGLRLGPRRQGLGLPGMGHLELLGVGTLTRWPFPGLMAVWAPHRPAPRSTWPSPATTGRTSFPSCSSPRPSASSTAWTPGA